MITDKIKRLKEIISEASDIIIFLNDYIQKFGEDDKYNTPISQVRFPLQTRFLNVCTSAGISTIGDCVRHNPAEILKYRNMGKKCLKQFRQALQEQYNIEW